VLIVEGARRPRCFDPLRTARAPIDAAYVEKALANLVPFMLGPN